MNAPLRDRTGLLIDDLQEMRSSVRIQLSDIGLEKCDQARNVKEAVERLTQRQYDLIICDYNLGQGADGQQLLELLRRRNLLPHSSVFLMITGETGYEQVSTAAEYAPDDYLLKPFTSELLRNRLLRILDKKQALQPLYQHLGEKGDSKKALAACDALLAGNSRYGLDILRHKGDLLMALGRHDEALALYESVLQQRSTPWAEVGKARVLAADGNAAAARTHLQEALRAYPNYLAAYDSLAELLEKDEPDAAQEVVERSLAIAPTTQRHRRLGALALENKDYARAETAFRRAVEKDRTGFFKSHDDYAGLAHSYAEQGKTQEALAALKEMGNHFRASAALDARQAAVESLVHAKAGDVDAAKAALARALKAGQGDELDTSTQLEIAQACFASGQDDEAKNILRGVAEDYQENEKVLAAAQRVFAKAGRDDEGGIFLDAAKRSMVKLNNEAVALAKAGELDKAIAMLTEAADRLHNNCQVAINAALALLMYVHRNGLRIDYLSKAHDYIIQARFANPEHPRLPEVETFYRHVAPPGTILLEE